MKKIKLFLLLTPYIVVIPAIALTVPSMTHNNSVDQSKEVETIYSFMSESKADKAIEINKEVSVDINYLFNILFPLLCILLVVPIVILVFYKLKDKYKKGKVVEKEPLSNYSFIASITNEIIEEVKGVSKITDEMQKDTLQDMGPKLISKEGEK